MYTFDSRSFAERSTAIVPTLESYDIPRATVTIIGGAALAAAGINAYVPGMGRHFDVDILIPDAELDVWYENHPPLPDDEIPEGILAVNFMRLEENQLKERTTPEEYWAMLARSVPPTEAFPFARLQPVDIAHHKIRRNSPKDSVGLVQAHLTAYRERRQIVSNPAWRSVIGEAIQALPGVIAKSKWESFWVPGWVDIHVENDFSHQAFADIPRS